MHSSCVFIKAENSVSFFLPPNNVDQKFCQTYQFKCICSVFFHRGYASRSRMNHHCSLMFLIPGKFLVFMVLLQVIFLKKNHRSVDVLLLQHCTCKYCSPYLNSRVILTVYKIRLENYLKVLSTSLPVGNAQLKQKTTYKFYLISELISLAYFRSGNLRIFRIIRLQSFNFFQFSYFSCF